MSEFQLRPVDGYRPPKYPAAEKPGDSPKAPFMANRLSPLAPLALLALGPVTTARAATPMVMTDAAPRESTPPIQVSLPAVDGLIEIALHARQEIEGKMASPSRVPTEGEIAGDVMQILADLGVKAESGRVKRDGVAMKLTALHGNAAIAILDVQSGDAIEELALLRARGEMKVLLLSLADYEMDAYENATRGRLPNREGVRRRLQEEIGRFLDR